MARRYHRRKSATSTRAIVSRKPTARTQKTQILSLKKKIDHNTKLLAGVRYKVTHTTRLAMNVDAPSAAQPYKVLPLNAPSNMTQIFSAPDEAEGGKYNWDSKGRTHLTLNIVSNNEPTPLPLQIFIVSCKNSKVAVSTTINTAGATFNLIPGVDYVNNLANATYMNRKRFNIHKHWMVNLSPILALSSGVPAQWQGDLHPIKRTFSMKNPLRLNNRVGNWQGTLDEAVNPSQRLFMIVFNNNIGTPSTYPIINGQVIHTAFTSE